jgi:5-methylcytosine-specific restriction protein A
MSLREVLSRVMSEYPTATRESFGQNPLASYIRHDAVKAISEALGAAARGLNIEGSAGAGNWAMVPWLAVFDPVVTDSATRGYYVVYLFHANTPTVHLSLNQGTTATREEFGPNTRKILADRATFMRNRLADFAQALPVTAIELGSDARLPADYAAGHAMGFTYRLDELPTDHQLQEDLKTIVHAYRVLTFRGGFDEVLEAGDGESAELGRPVSLLEMRRYRLHRRIERNGKAARAAKKHHGTRCQACDLDFGESYGPIGEGFIEAHHLRPISSLEEGVAFAYDVAADFAVLCSNCHRMIHRTDEPADVDALRRLMRIISDQVRISTPTAAL